MSETYLPYQVRMRVACYCAHKANSGAGWVTVPETPGMVCSHCGNPSPQVVLRHCMWCKEQFVLPRANARWKAPQVFVDGIGIVKTEVACFTCEPA